MILLVRQTDVRDLRHLVIEDRRADEGGYKSGPHLAAECDPWSDVHIMGELEILGKVKSLGRCDVTVGLEIIHSGGIACVPKTTEQLGDNVQGNLDVRDRHYDAARDTENCGEEHYDVSLSTG